MARACAWICSPAPRCSSRRPTSSLPIPRPGCAVALIHSAYGLVCRRKLEDIRYMHWSAVAASKMLTAEVPWKCGRSYGMGATLHDIECRMVNKIVHFEILKGMTVRVQDVKDPGLFEAQGFDARFVGEDELARFAHDGAHDVSLDFLRRARARGDRCYALFDGEALAAYGWYSDLPTPIDEHFVLHFDPAWTYMYKGYTVPAYRGKRLHAVGMCRALRAVTEEGRNGLISWVFSNNFASFRSV